MRNKSSKLITAIIVVLLAVLVLIVAIRAIAKPKSETDNESGSKPNVTETVPTPTPEPEKLTFQKAPDGYFDDALFIGDSRTVGVSYFKGDCCLANADFFCTVGMSTYNAFTESVSIDGVGTVGLSTLLASKHYSKVYIMTGLNELGWTNYDRFVQCYGDLVDRVRETHPEAQIYVIGILPVGAAATAEKDYLNNERVQMFNDYILGMCKDKNAFYVDGYAAVADSEGNLPDDAAPDGVHMEPKYCKMLTDYLLCHTVEA